MPKRTIIAATITEMDVMIKVYWKPNASASKPPNTGPNNVPVTLPICKVPSIFPASFFAVCEEINASEVGMKPVTTPFSSRSRKNISTESTNPIRKTDVAIPKPLMIRIGLKPYLSATRPQIGDIMKAVTNVAPKIRPDHF